MILSLLVVIGWATLVIVICIAVILLRRDDHTEKSVGAARDQVASLREENALDHEDMSRKIEKNSGRLQFLIAKEIAAELAEQKAQAEKGEPK